MLQEMPRCRRRTCRPLTPQQTLGCAVRRALPITCLVAQLVSTARLHWLLISIDRALSLGVKLRACETYPFNQHMDLLDEVTAGHLSYAWGNPGASVHESICVQHCNAPGASTPSAAHPPVHVQQRILRKHNQQLGDLCTWDHHRPLVLTSTAHKLERVLDFIIGGEASKVHYCLSKAVSSHEYLTCSA